MTQKKLNRASEQATNTAREKKTRWRFIYLPPHGSLNAAVISLFGLRRRLHARNNSLLLPFSYSSRDGPRKRSNISINDVVCMAADHIMRRSIVRQRTQIRRRFFVR